VSTRTAKNGAGVGDQPVTLQQALAALGRRRPQRDAPPEQWREFHLREAQLYATVADLDTAHHYEALALASLAQQDADRRASS
jgi:hypothetical protein